MPTTSTRPCIRICTAVATCLPLPAMASDFTGMLTGMTLMLLALTLLVLLPMLLFRRHAWVRWSGAVLGSVALLIGLGTVGVDTWRVVARTGAEDVLPVGARLLGYLMVWLAVAYVTWRLHRAPAVGRR
ncbi:hypothetical protein KQ945_02455 [Bacillus subtilis subsp. subtilis]|nr:hypothetical protein [Bacillus subtilis subsp. subtilis]